MGMEFPLASKSVNVPPLEPRYVSTLDFAPTKPLIAIPQSLSELTGPVYGHEVVKPGDADLTTQHKAPPTGERIIVHGRVVDEDGRPVPDTLVEVWQANAAGRYLHKYDNSPARRDPNFSGGGRTITDSDGRYRFVTIRPGAYPVFDYWRSPHIHFSLFGHAFASRLVTQLFFPGDPLHMQDPVFFTIPDAAARQRLVASLDMASAEIGVSLAYRYDLVLRGKMATPMETH